MTEFTNSLTGFADWYNKYQKLPEDKKTDAAIDAGENVAWWVGKRLAKNNLIGTAVENNWLGMGDGVEWLQRFVLGPQQGEPGRRIVPDFKQYQPPKLNYQVPYGDFQMPSALPQTMAPQFGSNPVIDYPPDRIQQQMQQRIDQSYNNNDNRQIDNSVNIAAGAVVIEGSNLSADDLLLKMQTGIQDIARRTQFSDYQDARIQYPSVGR